VQQLVQITNQEDKFTYTHGMVIHELGSVARKLSLRTEPWIDYSDSQIFISNNGLCHLSLIPNS
jgi:hypothetical protein